MRFVGWILMAMPLMAGQKVLVIPVSDNGKYMVDQVQADWIVEALDRAEEQGYDQIILTIDTFGGVVFSAREITERLLRVDIPTIAYVETKAISAGTFIAFACDEIVMEEKTTLGDAQVIMQTAEGIEEAPEKIVTVFRSDWKKACDENGHSFALAQGFFDAAAEVLRVAGADDTFSFMLRDEWELLDEPDRPKILEIVSKSGQLLTLHSGEADALGIATEVADFNAFLEDRGLTEGDLHRLEMETNDKILRFLGANTWIFFLLTIIGLNGLYMEIKAPGFGIPGLTALICFAIVFGSKFMLGTASPIEIALFALGIAMALVEIFVLPGFGIFGIASILLVFGSLLMATLPDIGEIPIDSDLQWAWLKSSALVLSAAFATSIALFAILLPSFLKLGFVQRRLLATELTATAGYVMDTVADRTTLKGQTGVAEGDLRPAGKLRLDDDRLLDVVSDSGYIDDGTQLKVVAIDGNRVIVRPVQGA
ncbi:MAG: hypothetical protein KDC35_14785 [Acidobacteria bacterium]|nr:hypothetical protein [Acidobacteriota bacterium]